MFNKTFFSSHFRGAHIELRQEPLPIQRLLALHKRKLVVTRELETSQESEAY